MGGVHMINNDEGSAAGIRPEDCPEPGWHETHRYCPVCTWTEPLCASQLRIAQGDLYVVECVLPPGHDGKHKTEIRWL